MIDRVEPANGKELRDALLQAGAEGISCSIIGGDTLQSMGRPSAGTFTIATTGLRSILAHAHHDLTCSIEAGLRLRALDDALAEHAQFVPLDAPQRREATAGGTLSAGWLGARRHLYGRARDYVIGSQAVLADGTIANAGGMVVKNVSGYDMSKLYIGSFGTLGVLTRLNFKTLPVPRCRRMLLAKLPEGVRSRAASQIASAAAVPAAAFCIEGFRKDIDGDDGVDGRLLIFLEGSASFIDRATRDFRSSLGRAGVPETNIVDAGSAEIFQRIVDATIASIGERSITYRSLGMPESALARGVALRDCAQGQRLFTDTAIDIMNGDVFVRVSDLDARAFAQKAEAADDALSAADPKRAIVAGNAQIREALDPWGEPPAAIEKMRALKRQFDPHTMLNPGRFIGGL